jgi:hypothetical protein
MPESIIDLVQQLHVALSEHPRLDPSTEEALGRLAKDIRDSLSAESGDNEESAASETLSGRVLSFLESYEAQNPKVTQTLSMIAERLADMGI